jgi:hypothetical protein
MFKIVNFAHFFVDLQPIRQKFKKYDLFDVLHSLALLYSENEVSDISTEKVFYRNVDKTPFFGTFNQIADF